MDCRNCEIPLSENQTYCYDCGARVIKNRLTIKSLLQQVNEEFMSVDNKLLKTFLLLCTKPDEVIVSYVEGTRKKYINVMQYFAIALTFLGIQVFFMEHIFNNPELYKIPFLEEFAKNVDQKNNPFLNGEFDGLNSGQSIAFTLGIPFSALSTWLSYWITGMRRYNFTEHIVINLYYGAHAVIVSAFIYIAMLGFGINFFIAIIGVSLFSYIYFFYVLKRIFKTSFLVTLGNFLLSLFIIGVMTGLAGIIGLIITIVSVT